MARNVETPFGTGTRLFTVAGVDICVHWTLGIAVGLLTMLLAMTELPSIRPGEAPVLYWLVGLLAAALFLVSLVAHELAHAIVAHANGLKAQRMTLWMLGGLTELGTEPGTPRAEARVSGAGPLTSLACGVAFGALAVAVGPSTLLGGALVWLAAMNALLAVFNLLPAAPLDGGRLLHAVVWWRVHDRARATRAASAAGRFLGSALIGLGVLSLLVGDIGGLWLALVGWFVASAARGEALAAQDAALAGLTGLTAADVMDPAGVVLPSWWTVETVLAQLGPAQAAQAVLPLVDADGAVTGGVTVFDLERASRRGAHDARLRDLRSPLPLVPGTASLVDVLRGLQLPPHVAVVVDDARHPLGVLELHRVDRVARLIRMGDGVHGKAEHLT